MPRRKHAWAIETVAVAVTIVACGGAEAPASSAAPAPDAIPIECRDAPPALTSYDAITDAVPFSLEVMRDERGAWLPRVPLAMPMHHASMITWTDETHELEAHTARDPVVIFATGLGRLSIEHDEARGVFFATYGARVDRVCPAGRAE